MSFVNLQIILSLVSQVTIIFLEKNIDSVCFGSESTTNLGALTSNLLVDDIKTSKTTERFKGKIKRCTPP